MPSPKSPASAWSFLPLTFSWAIVRYRMMDVDLIFKRGVTYTLATAALVGVYFALLAVAAALAQARLRSFGIWGLLAAIIVAALLFEPLKRVIQMRVDRLFDRQSYDYRATLIAFGRGLSSFTNLDAAAPRHRRSPAPHPARRPRRRLPARTHPDSYRLAAQHGLPETLGTRPPRPRLPRLR